MTVNGIRNLGETRTSTCLSSQQDTEENDRMIALVLSLEYAKMDFAVGSHLSIPNMSDDQQRLLQRLNNYGLREVEVSGDGNCQFRALSEQMYRSPKYHMHIRNKIVKQLQYQRSSYECFVPMNYKQYCKKMARSGEWGDHVTLQAAADKFAAKICILASSRDNGFIEIMPQHQAPKLELWLSYSSGVHYNSLRAI